MIITVEQLKALTFPKSCARCLRPASESLPIGRVSFLTGTLGVSVVVGMLVLITIMAPHYQESLGFGLLFVAIGAALLLGAQAAARRFATGTTLVVVPICIRCLARRRFAAKLGVVCAWAFVATYLFGMYFHKAGYLGPALLFNLVSGTALMAGAMMLYFPRPLLRVPKAGGGRVDLEVPRRKYAQLLKEANPDVLGAARV